MKIENINPRDFADKCIANLPYRPEQGQRALIEAIAAFLADPNPRKVFILNGYAGTGKTSVMASVVRTLDAFGVKSATMAPTGRAAKVASAFSGKPASTIHRRIYRPINSGSAEMHFTLATNRATDTLFFIDEASMITDSRGSDSLLAHLIRYVYSAPGCAMILSGDVAQLPPVGHSESPAMMPRRLAELGLTPALAQLTKPMRQVAESGILFNATEVRRALFSSPLPWPPALHAGRFPDVSVIPSTELADALSSSWATVGSDETIIITRSNKRANRFNGEIRARVLFADDPIQRSDRLVVSKNNYFWCAQNGEKGFIANGESAEVAWVGRMEKMYGRWFLDTELTFPGRSAPIAAKIMLRSLMAEGPAIPADEQQRFQRIVMDAYPGSLSEKLVALDKDPWFNALQVKYAYCVTCHKAQGGQWKHVYVDLSTIMPDTEPKDFYRWLYTAVTRATEKLFLVNPSFPTF